MKSLSPENDANSKRFGKNEVNVEPIWFSLSASLSLCHYFSLSFGFSLPPILSFLSPSASLPLSLFHYLSLYLSAPLPLSLSHSLTISICISLLHSLSLSFVSFFIALLFLLFVSLYLFSFPFLLPLSLSLSLLSNSLSHSLLVFIFCFSLFLSLLLFLLLLTIFASPTCSFDYYIFPLLHMTHSLLVSLSSQFLSFLYLFLFQFLLGWAGRTSLWGTPG